MPDTAQAEDIAPIHPAHMPTMQIWMLLSEMKAALASIQSSTNYVKDEQAAVRDRLHDLSNQLTPLMILPSQFAEMKAQHVDLKAQIEKIGNKVDTLLPVSERVTRLEPTVERLNADANKSRGAIWAVGLISAAFGTVIGIVISVVKWFGAPH